MIAFDKNSFWALVDVRGGDGCWLWLGTKNRKGYGMWRGIAKRQDLAHRTAFILSNGGIPDGMHICHRCDVPACCNPVHLFAGTARDNAIDRDAKGRGARGVTHYSKTRPDRVPRGDRNGTRTMPESRPRGDDHHARANPELMARGASHGMAKLTDAIVLEIRRIFSANKTQRGIKARLARDYGMSWSALNSILMRETWRHVGE